MSRRIETISDLLSKVGKGYQCLAVVAGPKLPYILEKVANMPGVRKVKHRVVYFEHGTVTFLTPGTLAEGIITGHRFHYYYCIPGVRKRDVEAVSLRMRLPLPEVVK